MQRLLAKCEWEGACLVWTGTGTPNGYGTFRHTTENNGPKAYVHVWVYEQTIGEVPEGMEIDHTCRTRRCVNPAHLEAVTHAVNMERSRLEMCRAGLHDLTDPDNVRWDEKGWRRGCLACKKDRQRERAASMKGGQ
jgi:hypothetical protein